MYIVMFEILNSCYFVRTTESEHLQMQREHLQVLREQGFVFNYRICFCLHGVSTWFLTLSAHIFCHILSVALNSNTATKATLCPWTYIWAHCDTNLKYYKYNILKVVDKSSTHTTGNTILTPLDGRFASLPTTTSRVTGHLVCTIRLKSYCNVFSSVTWIMPSIACSILPSLWFFWVFIVFSKALFYTMDVCTPLPRVWLTMLMLKYKSNTSSAKSPAMGFCMTGTCYQ